MTDLRQGRPRVLKAAGMWAWTCCHGGNRVGDEFSPVTVRDPWTAALVSAMRHAAAYHDTSEGEPVERGDWDA